MHSPRFAHRDDVEVVWRSFELDPTAPTAGDLDLVGRLASKYGVSRSQAEAMNERVTRIADDEGLVFRLDIARPGRTFDAHRLLHLAAERGRQSELEERLLRAYQEQGKPIATPRHARRGRGRGRSGRVRRRRRARRRLLRRCGARR